MNRQILWLALSDRRSVGRSLSQSGTSRPQHLDLDQVHGLLRRSTAVLVALSSCLWLRLGWKPALGATDDDASRERSCGHKSKDQQALTYNVDVSRGIYAERACIHGRLASTIT